MKRPTRIQPLIVLIISAVAAISFRSNENTKINDLPCAWFTYNGGSYQDPESYERYLLERWGATPVCPGPDEFLCAICVPIDEIYYGLTLSDDKPKVDIAATNIVTFLEFKLYTVNRYDEFTTTSDNDYIAVLFKPYD